MLLSKKKNKKEKNQKKLFNLYLKIKLYKNYNNQNYGETEKNLIMGCELNMFNKKKKIQFIRLL